MIFVNYIAIVSFLAAFPKGRRCWLPNVLGVYFSDCEGCYFSEEDVGWLPNVPGVTLVFRLL